LLLVVLEAQHQEHSRIVQEEMVPLVVVQPQVHSRIVQEEIIPLVVEAQHQARSITAREEALLLVVLEAQHQEHSLIVREDIIPLVVLEARYQGNYTTVDLQRVRSKHWLKEASCVPVLTAQIPSLIHLIMMGRNKLYNIEMHGYYTVI
jgi:hypothetical protein